MPTFSQTTLTKFFLNKNEFKDQKLVTVVFQENNQNLEDEFEEQKEIKFIAYPVKLNHDYNRDKWVISNNYPNPKLVKLTQEEFNTVIEDLKVNSINYTIL